MGYTGSYVVHIIRRCTGVRLPSIVVTAISSTIALLTGLAALR